ncbi:MAG TPA: circularly permuted type 2 ATP-grasp protein [Myxococcales bacterium]|nr:circularly permuted type 2 ATP-grasp protein [Myxococcales bacterium]
MRLLLEHRSRYVYPRPAILGPHLLRLRPAAHARARVESYALRVTAPGEIRWQQDPAGNHVARATWPGVRLAELEVAVELSLDSRPVNPFDFTLDSFAEQTPFSYGPLANDLSPYLGCGDGAYACGARTQEFFASLPSAGATVPLVSELNRLVHERVRYVIRDEPGVLVPEETLRQGSGSCRDSAVLLVSALRSRGLAARFVSGYLVQLADEARLPDQATGVSSDVLALHAWAEVFLPGAGWLGLDATSGLFCGEGHVPLACSAVPFLAAPVEGTSDVAAEGVSFEMRVERLAPAKHGDPAAAPGTGDQNGEVRLEGPRSASEARPAESAQPPALARAGGASGSLFEGYEPISGTYDELFESGGGLRSQFSRALGALAGRTRVEFARSLGLAELALLNQGVTFSVLQSEQGAEKIFPFCLLPRLILADAWRELERGLVQRLSALSLFLDDVYGEQRIISEGRIPRDLVLGAKHYLPALRGVRPPGGVRVHVSGIDLIRDPAGTWRVLEDNLRTPSGVSYVLENRLVSKRVLPRAFDAARVQRVDHYPARLAETLRSVSPEGGDASTVVLLTPGPFNSAYFEHSFLARTMGVELVEAADLTVDDDRVWLRTTLGPRRVHVVYRRTDEPFLDPEVFRKDSLIGVPGLMRAYAKGNVALANAPGNGVADDKAVYAFVPEMIRFYLSEEPLLAQVPTWLCLRDDDRAFVLEHLDELVVKAVDEAGGYGMLMGPQSTAEERAEFARRIRAEPRRYIAQRRIELSTCPTWDKASAAVVPRRVDLRPYLLFGKGGPWVLPGGLTRVALVAGSYVVNSSQGGGSKDTWVLKA